ncbi:MAG TPA: efflux transporter outer membrane subunit [Rhizomicrobium sp.]|jgi:NodT family efflux transporter outer membrane factor (OMF) lipoprotein
MKRLLSLLLATTLLAGCVDAPSTTPSQTALEPQSLGLSAAPTPAIEDAWWKAFNDPQLDALVDQALAGSPTLQLALARMREAQSQLSVSRAATYPQLTVDAQEQREHFSKEYVIPPPPFGPGGTMQWIGTVQANLSWSLDFFGKQAAQVDQARSTAEAAALDATAARLALAGSVTQAYIALDRAYLLADVADETVKQREGVLRLTQGRVNSGLDSKASDEQARALLAVAKEDLIRAQAERDLAVHAIAALIGRGADAYSISRPRLDSAALSLPAVLPVDLLARRADIAAAEARVDAATSGRQAAHQAFYPDINLVGAAGFAAIGLGGLFTGNAAQYALGPAIHLPIFDAGALRAKYAGATAGLDEAVASYNQSVVTAVKQTSDAITQLQSLQAQAAQQGEALHASSASFDLATRRYRSGLSPQLNVLSAEDVLIQAKRQDASISADLLSARVSLLMALGGGYAPANDNSNTASNDQDHGQ